MYISESKTVWTIANRGDPVLSQSSKPWKLSSQSCNPQTHKFQVFKFSVCVCACVPCLSLSLSISLSLSPSRLKSFGRTRSHGLEGEVSLSERRHRPQQPPSGLRGWAVLATGRPGGGWLPNLRGNPPAVPMSRPCILPRSTGYLLSVNRAGRALGWNTQFGCSRISRVWVICDLYERNHQSVVSWQWRRVGTLCRWIASPGRVKNAMPPAFSLSF
jgi:hypothetical protein